ncbi:M20 family metallopeptidase [Bordetella petrii]|uniref:M20 family metallopeptidase n=1 Tax=Bordetella petrii TaxID=94624 RepID=UPI001E2F24A7|nr:M20 family metallopeptidase [Bordetella petrii]MCD0502992.1 M20 family metallopeptidase [Bordetella petrii]
MTSLPSTEALVAGIQSWVRCESPSNSPEGVAAMAALVEAQARAAGLTVEITPLDPGTGPLLYATNRAAGDTRPGILVLAHLDTVHPVGTLQDNPCRIEDDRLYGPGSYDMKGGIYLALAALSTLAQPGATRLPVDFLMVPDEEIGSHASRASIERYAANAKYGLVCEPARPNGGRCVTARKGTGMLRLNVKGRPAHAGMQHEKGRSAIREMAHQVLALEAMTDYERGVTVSVGTIAGGTVTNTVPAQCRCVVDFRVPDMGAAEDVLRRMRNLCAVGPDVELDIDVELNRPPMVRSDAAAALLSLAQGYAREAGFDLEEAPMTGGGSDANFTSAMGVPTLDGLGADGDGAHTLHEYILVSTLQTRAKFWQLLLRELA